MTGDLMNDFISTSRFILYQTCNYLPHGKQFRFDIWYKLCFSVSQWGASYT